MILLTKLDNSPILVSLEAIKFCEKTPDTLIFFVNGDTLMVRESLEEVERRVIELKKRILKDSSDQQNL